MPDEKIIKYYLLCSTRLGTRKHIVNELPNKKVSVILSKKEVELFLRVQDGNYVAREIIVGGSQAKNADPIIII